MVFHSISNFSPNPSIADRELSIFFESEFRPFSDCFSSNAFYDNSNLGVYIYRIDSEEELKAYYKGEKTLPVIDFEDKTLIVGNLSIPVQLTGLYKKQSLSKSEDGYFMNLFFAAPSTYMGPAANTYFFFWGLYPKLENDSMTIFLWVEKTIYQIIKL